MDVSVLVKTLYMVLARAIVYNLIVVQGCLLYKNIVLLIFHKVGICFCL